MPVNILEQGEGILRFAHVWVPRGTNPGKRLKLHPSVLHAYGYIENWISYGNPHFSAKELTVFPGRSVVIKDSGPYGMVMVQGHGHLGHWLIRDTGSNPVRPVNK